MTQETELLGLLFHGCQRAYQVALQAELTARGMDGAGTPALMLLMQYSCRGTTLPTQKELAETLQISPAAVAMSLKALEGQGYILRQADPDDQRCKRITITPDGLAAARVCWDAICTVNQQMLAGFSPEECAQLAGYQRRMLQNLSGKWSDLPENPFERMECQCSKP